MLTSIFRSKNHPVAMTVFLLEVVGPDQQTGPGVVPVLRNGGGPGTARARDRAGHTAPGPGAGGRAREEQLAELSGDSGSSQERAASASSRAGSSARWLGCHPGYFPMTADNLSLIEWGPGNVIMPRVLDLFNIRVCTYLSLTPAARLLNGEINNKTF